MVAFFLALVLVSAGSLACGYYIGRFYERLAWNELIARGAIPVPYKVNPGEQWKLHGFAFDVVRGPDGAVLGVSPARASK